MGFKPNNDDKHAITEVVFGITLSRLITHKEIEVISASHDSWKEQLPKMGLINVVEFAFPDAPPAELSQQQVGGVVFDRFKSNGDLDMRLRIEESGVFINVLNYTRWAEIAPQAYDLFNKIASLLQGEAFITSSLLQYVDVFEWHAEDDEVYDVRKLLNEESIHIPPATFHEDTLWHLHQGRFRKPDGELGRVLERVNLDGLEPQESKPIVKMEIYLQHQYSRSNSPSLDFMRDKDRMNILFDALHNHQKMIAKEYLSKEICERIELNG